MRQFTTPFPLDTSARVKIIQRLCEGLELKDDPNDVVRDVAMALTGNEIEFHKPNFSVRVTRPLGKIGA